MNTAIIVAAGIGTRFGGDTPKQFVKLAGRPILSRSIEKFDHCDGIDSIIVVAAAEFVEQTRELVEAGNFTKPVEIVAGGATRAASTANGLSAIKGDDGIVLVHDAARPLVSVSDIQRVIEAAAEFGAACLASPVADTIKRVANGEICETIDRSSLMSAQTPQGFRVEVLRRAFAEAAEYQAATDECSLVESLGERVSIVAATSPNLKITTQDDLRVAETMLRDVRAELPRIGFGTDFHRLEAGGPLVLGGVAIDCDLQAVGHSDGDVLLHAVTDAILGAVAAGDIGTHFSDTDERWRGADSRKFLEEAMRIAKEQGLAVGNLDAVIELERPKIRPFIDEMRQTLSEITGLEIGRVSVKAKTREGVGEIGGSRAISATATVLLLAADRT
ncbi:MAG: 2-C-methyl-D-erythritol 4-phosphate cytidylyltransferase [Pyrinomonadaceae bacterium]